MLVKAYGQFWNPSIVYWGAKGKNNKASLRGKVKIASKVYDINFWDARGVYVLYENFKCIYVGKALDTGLGFRLKCHLSDRLAGRWDMFSFYSVSHIVTTKLNTKLPGTQPISVQDIVNSLEALAILVADPGLNRKRERFKDAHEAIQIEEVEYQDDHANKLEEVNKRLETIEKLLLAKK